MSASPIQRRTVAAASLLLALGPELLAARALFGSGFCAAHPVAETFTFHSVALPLIVAAWICAFPADSPGGTPIRAAMGLALSAPLPLLGILFLGVARWLLARRRVEPLADTYVVGEELNLQPAKVELAGHISHSVIEILNSTETAVRRKAILALRSVEAKKSVPVLQRAIQDSDEQVRLLAQTQFNRILANLEMAVKTMEADLKMSPQDPSRMVHLAEQYHELVYLGLSSEETQTIHLGRAIELLQQALALAPDTQAARFLLLKCFLKAQKLAEANECLRTLESAAYEPEILAPWKSEIYFLERNWRDLRQSLAEMRQRQITDPALNKLIHFWLEEEAAE